MSCVLMQELQPTEFTLQLRFQFTPCHRGDSAPTARLHEPERMMGEPVFLPFPHGYGPNAPLPSRNPQPRLELPPSAQPRMPTVREVHTRFCRPDDEVTKSAATLSADLTQIGHFEAGCEYLISKARGQREYRTLSPVLSLGSRNPGEISSANPSVDEVDGDVLIAIRNWMLTVRNSSNDSCRKVLTTVVKVLRAAKKRKLIGEVPELPKIPKTKNPVLPVEMDEVDAIYRACHVATWPKCAEIPPSQTWRCWTAMFWIYGPRTQDFVGYKETRNEGLLRSEVFAGEACPNPDLRKITNPHGWVEWIPDKTSRTRGESIALPLSAVAKKHLQPFIGLDAVRVFPNGRSKTSFSKQWKAILREAGLTNEITISGSGRRNGVVTRSIRKGCSNNWDDVREGFGSWILGHAPQGTNRQYYKSVLPTIVNLIDDVPLPPSFTS